MWWLTRINANQHFAGRAYSKLSPSGAVADRAVLSRGEEQLGQGARHCLGPQHSLSRSPVKVSLRLSLRSALTGTDRDTGESFFQQAMAGTLHGSTLSTYQRSLILLLTETGCLMEGLICLLILRSRVMISRMI